MLIPICVVSKLHNTVTVLFKCEILLLCYKCHNHVFTIARRCCYLFTCKGTRICLRQNVVSRLQLVLGPTAYFLFIRQIIIYCTTVAHLTLTQLPRVGNVSNNVRQIMYVTLRNCDASKPVVRFFNNLNGVIIFGKLFLYFHSESGLNGLVSRCVYWHFCIILHILLFTMYNTIKYRSIHGYDSILAHYCILCKGQEPTFKYLIIFSGKNGTYRMRAA